MELVDLTIHKMEQTTAKTRMVAQPHEKSDILFHL